MLLVFCVQALEYCSYVTLCLHMCPNKQFLLLEVMECRFPLRVTTLSYRRIELCYCFCLLRKILAQLSTVLYIHIRNVLVVVLIFLLHIYWSIIFLLLLNYVLKRLLTSSLFLVNQCRVMDLWQRKTRAGLMIIGALAQLFTSIATLDRTI